MLALSKALISVVEASKAGLTLLCLRNPWGNEKEWNGPWSDKSSLWSTHPRIAEEVGFVPAEDGLFWMCYDDFQATFAKVFICCKSMRAHGRLARKSPYQKVQGMTYRSMGDDEDEDDEDDEDEEMVMFAKSLVVADDTPSAAASGFIATSLLAAATVFTLGFAAGVLARRR